MAKTKQYTDEYKKQIVELYNSGKNKTAGLVKEAIQRINRPLSDIKIFHTGRGSEFKNKEIDEIISAFGITRSLSHKGCQYDNAVAEVTYNIIKTEFVFGEKFNILIMLTGISQTVMLGLKLTNMSLC